MGALTQTVVSTVGIDRKSTHLLAFVEPFDGGANVLTNVARSSHITNAVKRNIQVLDDMRRRAEEKRSGQDKIADKITKFSGSMTFLWLHVAWFAFWIVANVGAIPGLKPFDEFPFGLLTLVVSLEAIFLSTVVLISQNREAELASRKEAMDLAIDLLSEYEVTHTLRLVRKIAEKLEIELEDGEIDDLCAETNPKDLITEIERSEAKKD